MRLLVTGGTGFIGSHLAEDALRGGAEVTVLGLVDRPEEHANAELLRGLGARICSGSVTDPELCREAMQDITHVYHLAVAMREAGVGDEYFRDINLRGTRHLLELARDASVERFVYCGTIGIYGHQAPGITNEDSPLRPGNIYEETKVAAEALVREFHERDGLATVVLRPADVYGPRDMRLLKMFRAVSRGRFPLFGSGGGRRHMVYVSDVVDAFRAALDVPGAVGAACIIAGPEVCTLREFLELVARAAGAERFGFRLPLAPMRLAAAATEDVCSRLGVSPPIYRRRMDFFDSDSAFDITRARMLLSWQPQVDLQTGVNRTLAAYRASGSPER